jgi:hypothetical protein
MVHHMYTATAVLAKGSSKGQFQRAVPKGQFLRAAPRADRQLCVYRELLFIPSFLFFSP